MKQAIWIALSVLVLGGCELSSDPGDDVVGGVDMAVLFAEPTDVEKSAVELDWALRDVSPKDVLLEQEGTISIAGKGGTVRVISHRVAGEKHYGAVITPDGLDPRSAPVLVYTHGGDSGVSVDDEVLLLLSFFGDIFEKFVYVVPSFRGETIEYDQVSWTSEGPDSPWDYDVDDALSLLNATFDLEPASDPERVGVLGFSRGAGVGMLMDARSDKIDAVLSFFGPTDFFGPFVQEVTREVLLGNPRNLPGLDYVTSEYVVPLQNKAIALDEARLALVRRSSVLFVDEMSRVQLHHGTADLVVPVTQAQLLIKAMEDAGKTTDEFESFIYDGGDHNPLTLEGSLTRARDFLLDLAGS